MDSTKPSFLSQSSVYFFSNVARRGLSFFLLPIYTRYLSPSEYGVIEIVELLAAVMIIVLGVPVFADSITRIYFDYSDRRERVSVISTGMMLTIFLSTIVILIGALGGGIASKALFHTTNYASLIAWTFTSVLLSNVAEVGLAFQRIQRRASFVAIYSCSQFALAGGLNVYFLAFARKGIWGFVLSKLISMGVGAFFIFIVTVRETGFGFNPEAFRRMIHFGKGLVLTSIGFFIIHFSDRIFLNSFKTTTEVGIYALAYKFGFVISYLVGNPFKSVWEVNAFEYMHSPQWKFQAAKMAQYFFLSLSGVALILSVFARPIIAAVASSSYAMAAGLIPILTFAYVMREMGDFFSSILFINKRMAQYASAVILCAGLNLFLDWTLIRTWGGAGAAWATFFTWLAYMVVCCTMAQREHQLPLELRRFGSLSAICALCITAAFIPGTFSFVPDLLIRFLMILIAGGLIWKSGYISQAQHAEIRDHLKLPLKTLRSAFSVQK